MVADQLADLDAPDRLTPADVDTLMTELGGLTEILHHRPLALAPK
jgi:hypothetical protein